MANEIAVNVSANVSNGNLKFTFSPGTVYVDQAAVGGPTPGQVVVGTTEETISLAELTTYGWVFIQNLDSTNFVEWGFSAGVYGGKLEPGEVALFRLKHGASLRMKADTAACKVLVYALED